jgi:putative PIN family toxin of toxin-antitoxin system
LGKSYPHKIIFDLVFIDRVRLFVSPAILEEYKGVLSRKKFQKKSNFQVDAKNLLESISDLSTIITPKVSFDILPDKSDNKFLELSVASQADFLITGKLKTLSLQSI